MNIGRYLTDNLMKLSADGGCFRLMTIVHELMHVLGKSKCTNKNKVIITDYGLATHPATGKLSQEVVKVCLRN